MPDIIKLTRHTGEHVWLHTGSHRVETLDGEVLFSGAPANKMGEARFNPFRKVLDLPKQIRFPVMDGSKLSFKLSFLDKLASKPDTILFRQTSHEIAAAIREGRNDLTSLEGPRDRFITCRDATSEQLWNGPAGNMLRRLGGDSLLVRQDDTLSMLPHLKNVSPDAALIQWRAENRFAVPGF
jgi:hypothetical protein